MKNSAEWKGYANEIQHTVNRSSIQWMLILVSFFYGIVTLYLLIDDSALKQVSAIAYTATIVSIIFSSQYFWEKSLNVNKFFLSSIMLSIAWVSLAFVIYHQWGEVESASDLIVIGFICSILGYYSHFYLLMMSSTILTATYLALQMQILTISSLDLFITVIKFPVLLVLFMHTIRKLLLKGQYHVVKNEMLKRQLQRLNIIDDLTQIQNRKGFRLAMASALASAHRFKLGFSLLILDVDFFKQFNDNLGHPEGDKCLIKIAQLLSDTFQRETDTVTRLGGEEFAILIPDVDWHSADIICKRIHDNIERAAIMHPNSTVSRQLTVSIGGAIYKNGDDEKSIYSRADKALYQAKAQGRNCSIILANEDQATVKSNLD